MPVPEVPSGTPLASKSASRRIALAPAAIGFDARGIPSSPLYGDVYHSADGGAAQARHVFLAGNGLPARWRGRRQFTILETGFGLGLNFLETWRAWEDDPERPARLHFVSVEAHPVTAQDLLRAHAGRPEHTDRLRALAAAWPLPLAGFHRLHFPGKAGSITLTLLLGAAERMLPQLQAHADALYLDGFAPDRNPELWSPQVFAALARLCAPGATLATWSVAGDVRTGLSQAGFRVEKRQGFGAKRDMLAGEFAATSISEHAFTPPARRALVLGAGLAGTACAARLAARGWDVDLIEREARPAEGASGNPLALAAPLLNLADGPNARFSRAAFLCALRHFAALSDHGLSPIGRGVLRVARDERGAQRFAQLIEVLGVPTGLASYSHSGEGARHVGRAVARDGLWLPGGVTLAPADLCKANLDSAGTRVHAHFHRAVTSLAYHAGGWEALDAAGRVIAAAPVAILANAIDALQFAPGQLRLEAIRGQVTLLPAGAARRLDAAVTGESHALPFPDGRILIGAGFQPGDQDLSVRVADHADNMARIQTQLPGLCAGLDPGTLTGRAGFRTVTPDRLPLFGALQTFHDEPGLFVAAGLGARGLVWATLGAELIAAQLEGEPWPVERELVAAVHPDRFSHLK
jgi:tRNA 5-methylaminomethyl-2-thiouridine biosynthesis bifunctional protein